MESTGKRNKKQSELSHKVKKRKTLGSSSNRRGKKWSQKERDLVYRVDSWMGEAMKREKRGERVFESRSRAKETGKICGVSKMQVLRLKSKHAPHHVDETGIEREISEVSKNMGRPRIELDDFDKTALSRLILGYYLKPQPEIPTLAKIHTDALKMPGFPAMSIATLSRWVKKLGFVCKRRNRKLQVYQRLDIVASRQRYLRRVRELESAGYKIFNQDETWCNANHTRKFIWQFDDETERDIPGTRWKGGLKVPTGRGKRLIVNHLGSEDGFLNGCEECRRVGAKDSADYHKEMNTIHFERWLEDSVLPTLPTKSFVIIDNARYHSRQTEESRAPTTNWRKAQIQDWLRKKGVDC